MSRHGYDLTFVMKFMCRHVSEQQQRSSCLRVTLPALVLLDRFRPAIAIFVQEPLHEFIRFRKSCTDVLHVGAFRLVCGNIHMLVYLLKREGPQPEPITVNDMKMDSHDRSAPKIGNRLMQSLKRQLFQERKHVLSSGSDPIVLLLPHVQQRNHSSNFA